MNIQESNIKDKMVKINQRLTYYNEKYYGEEISKISDFEYDILFHELKQLERKYPKYKLPNTVTENIGFKAKKHFSKFTHPMLMGSLENAFSIDEVINFFIKKKKDINYSWKKLGKLSVSLKFDGLALELIYRQGKLIVGASRGDGTVGENITDNVKQIKAIPKQIIFNKERKFMPEFLVIRGELVMNIAEFNAINEHRKKVGKNLVSSPRNLVSGMMRQINPDLVSQNLNFFSYQLMNWEELTKFKKDLFSHEKTLETLTNWGFDCNPYTKTITSMEELRTFLIQALEFRNNLHYEIDGVVIKIDNGHIQKLLGESGKRPRYAIAWKMPPEIKTTKLLDVEYNVGRSGKVTPVGILKAIKLSGAVIKRVTLHNTKEIKKKDLRIGDTVRVIRSGDVIPKILNSKINLRTGIEIPIKFPFTCPVCETILSQKDILTYCINDECPAKHYQKIVHFTSKLAMNIYGVGKELIKELIHKKKITDVADIYRLKGEDLDSFERMGEKLKRNILIAIDKSKRVSFDRFIYSLGIPGIGQKMSKIISRHFEKLQNLTKISIEELKQELSEINEIGEKSAEQISKFFNNEKKKN